MNFFEKWNKGRFSVYESEEKTALKLIENINNFIGKLSQGVDNKTDLYGDHKGSWQGLNRPTLSEEGMRATVEKHIADINLLSEKIDYDNQLKLRYKYNIKGDGINDDSVGIQKALDDGLNIDLWEGTFLINKPIMVDVEKQYFRGTSSRTILKQGPNLLAGSEIITFFSRNGQYSTRYKRLNMHGNFAIHGEKTLMNQHGLRLGGKEGSEYEGHIDQQIFTNIFIQHCSNMIIYGSHVYKCIFQNVQGHENNYSLISSEGQTDAGEALLFLNCAFWGGLIDIKKKAYFYACTIHPSTRGSDKDGCIVLRNETFGFTNCHFEQLGTGALLTTKYKNIFYSDKAQVNFLNCDATLSGEGATLTESCFKVDGDNNGYINVQGGNWRYFFTRLQLEEGAFLCKGNVKITDQYTPNMFTTNRLTRIYDNSKSLINKNYNGDYGFELIGALKGHTPTITTIRDGINITSTKETASYYMIGKIVPVGNKKGGLYSSKIRMNLVGMKSQFQFKNGQNEVFGLGFLDKDKNVINIGDNKPFLETIECTQVGQIAERTTMIFGIPSNCEYILYGVSCLHYSNEVNLDILECKLELW